MARILLAVALIAQLAEAWSPPRRVVARPRVGGGSRGGVPRVFSAAAVAGGAPPERWSWSGPTVPAAARETVAAVAAVAGGGGGGAQRRLVGLLAFHAGVADLVLFRKHGCYATMMTGNLIKGTCAVVGYRWREAGFFAAVTASYLVGVAAFRATDVRLGRGARAGRVAAVFIAAAFALSDALPSGVGSAGAVVLAAGFGAVNSVSVDVLATITWMLTIHMHKLTAVGVDALGLSGKAARAAAKLDPTLKRSVAVLAAFAGGVAAGAGICAAFPAFVNRGFATAMGASYAAVLLAHDYEGRVGFAALSRSLGACAAGDVCDTD